LLPVARSMSRRLRSANLRSYRSAIPPTSLSVAIVPLTPLPPAFVAALAERLASDGKVIALSAAMFDEAHGAGASRTGPSDPRSPHLSSWLAQLEEDHRYVLYIADGEPSEWTDRCLRHADRIVFSIAFDAEAAPEQIRRWRALPPVQARREIVFWHPPDRTALPQHTAAVLRELPVERHHHLRLGNSDDIARLGRFLTNRPICLVLSGGGARGFAHIGAYQALCEAGVPIDRVIGTSMGGFIGALIACRYELPEITRLVRRVLVDRGGFGYTLPLLAVLQVRRSEARLRAVFEGRDLEDTWLPFSCCATNLTSSRLMVLSEGPLWRACRATTAVPGLCPPVFHQGDVLVDGAVLDNVPVDVASELEPGPLITCDVTKARALTVDPSLDTAPPLLRLLWDRLSRRGAAESLPNIGTILTRSLDCTSRFRQESNRRMATLYFEPPVGDYGLLDMERIDKFIDIGYRHVAEQLRRTDLNCVFDYRHEPEGLTSA
jgi:NTE family protein